MSIRIKPYATTIILGEVKDGSFIRDVDGKEYLKLEYDSTRIELRTDERLVIDLEHAKVTSINKYLRVEVISSVQDFKVEHHAKS